MTLKNIYCRMLHLTCTVCKEKKTKVEKGGVFQIKAIIEASSVSNPHWAIYLNADPDLALPSN
jgi:hypothetical protein